MMYRFVSLISAGLLLSSCAPVVIGAGVGAAALGASAVQEGGINRAVSDARIQATINDLWFRHDTEIYRKLDLTVDQGRVLITGVVQNPEHRVDAVRLAWKAKGVKQVINEIKVANSSGVGGYLSDRWIGTQLRSGLVADTDIQNLNYNIDVLDKVVYLMGTAQSQSELNKVVSRARKIRGVKQVVSYVKFAGEDITDTSGPGGQSGRPANSGNYDNYDNYGAPSNNQAPGQSAPIDLGPPPENSAYPQDGYNNSGNIEAEPLY